MQKPSNITLGLDTSAGHCSAALVIDGVLVEATQEIMRKGQAERLFGLLQELLARHDLQFHDLNALGVGIGPGNFTGIRIGVSAARGLALGLGIPAYGVDGFEQRAHMAPQANAQMVMAPREQRYVRHAGADRMMKIEDIAALGLEIRTDPEPQALAGAVAMIAATRWPQTSAPPAPYYLKAPDAAPAKDVPPVILP